MKVSQLKTLICLINNNFNVSLTAEQLCLVQSAVSQQLKRLETELGSEVFVRKGKRLVGLTELGSKVESHARASLLSINNISLIAQDYERRSHGSLKVGCTHSQARYILPPIIKKFNQCHPQIELQMHQGTPKQLVEWTNTDQVDFAICTEELGQSANLECISGYQWNRCLVTLPDHPIQQHSKITLKQLCQYPIITYVAGFTGRENLNAVFTEKNLTPNIILSAADTDIIKAYVKDNLGIGIIASMAYNSSTDKTLKQKDLSHLFPWETTRIAYQKNKYISNFQQTFIDLFLEMVQQDKSQRFRAL